MTAIDAAVFNTYIVLTTALTFLFAHLFYHRVEKSLRGVLAGVALAAVIQILTKNVLLVIATELTALSPL